MPNAASLAQALWTDRLSPPSDRDRIDLYLSAFLAESRRRHAASPHVRPLYEQASEFVLHGGKRLRPRLCVASFRILSGRSHRVAKPVWLAAASLEIFHAFMLVHDDLIDGSVLRRERATLHEAIRHDLRDPNHSSARKHASDLALVAGDLLCALGMRMLSRSGLDDATQVRSYKLIADVLLETGVGQALDILYENCPLDRLSESQIVEAYQRKTARYSISGPLVLGSILAGSSAPIGRVLSRFGDLLGFGYQVQNDLESLLTDLTYGDHADLDTGKRTLVLWLAYELGSDRCRRAINEALEMPVGLDRRQRLFTLIQQTGAIDECRSRLDRVGREASELLRDTGLDTTQRRGFLALMQLFAPAAGSSVSESSPSLVAFPVETAPAL